MAATLLVSLVLLLGTTRMFAASSAAASSAAASSAAPPLAAAPAVLQQPSHVGGSSPSCYGFLLGIGAQKGGTTALWAYLADHAHPQLQVSAVKEVNYWDRLHTRYAGCRVGDYLHLLTAHLPAANASLDICSAHSSIQTGDAGPGVTTLAPSAGSLQAAVALRQPEWADPVISASSSLSSVSRLKPSAGCQLAGSNFKTPAQGQPTAVPRQAPARGTDHAAWPDSTMQGRKQSVGSFKLHDSSCPEGLFLPGDVPPARPWWWFGDWPGTSTGTACLQKQVPARSTGQPPQQDQELITGERRPVSRRGLIGQQQRSKDARALLPPRLLQQQGPGAVASPVPKPLFHVDITPRYLHDPAVPPRVRSLLPEARIVVLLRDPVARAVSNFNMWWQGHRPANASSSTWASTLAAQVDAEAARLTPCYRSFGTSPATRPDLDGCLGVTHPFDAAYDRMLFDNRLLTQGMYADALQRWFELFPAQSFMILVSEDFKADPARHIRELAAWLGLEPALLHARLQPGRSHGSSAQSFKPVHARKHEGAPHAASIAAMRQFFAPHNQRLFQLLESKGFAQVAARLRQVWATAP